MKIEQPILSIIERGTVEDNLYFLPPEQLDRKTYLKINKVLENLGGKWSRKIKAHIFESDISDAIDNVLLTGEVVAPKDEFQFFETPKDVVDLLIDLAEVRPEHTCLEPSAGNGAIAEALCAIVGPGMLTCLDLNPQCVEVLRNKRLSAYECDFLQYNDHAGYDRIVMNPPFTKQQDISHVEKALTMLKEGGILVSVMSVGVEFRQNRKTLSFWDKVGEHGCEVIKLPHGAFKVSGTMINTVVLKVIK